MIGKNISAFNARTRFSPGGFNRIIKVIMVHDLNPQNLHINKQLFFFSFFRKSKKCYFWGVFDHYPQNEIFSPKFCSVSFLALRHPSFMRSFRKILEAIWRKSVYLLTYWHFDILTYWQWRNHRSPFCLTEKQQQQNKVSKQRNKPVKS